MRTRRRRRYREGTPGDVTPSPARALGAAIITLTAGVLPGFLTGALGGAIGDELGFGKAGLGVAIASAYSVAAIGSVHAGELSDRIGPRRTLLAAMAMSLLGFLGIAAFAHSLANLLVFLVIAASGHTLAGTATKVLVARQVPLRRHGLAFGMQMAAIPFAAVLAGFAVPVISETIGWRWAFLFGAALPVLGAAALPQEGQPKNAVSRPRGFDHVDLPPLFVLGAAAVLASAAATTTATFYIISAEEVGISAGTAGSLLAATSAAVIAVRIAFGAVADRFRGGHLTTVVLLLCTSSFGYLLMAPGIGWLFAVGALVALVFGWSWPGLMVFALVRAYPDAPGVASAFVVGGMNLGSVIGPVVFGVVSDALSAPTAFGTLTLWTMAASLACAGGQKQLRRHSTGAPRENRSGYDWHS